MLAFLGLLARYDPKQVEEKWYSIWEQNGLFQPRPRRTTPEALGQLSNDLTIGPQLAVSFVHAVPKAKYATLPRLASHTVSRKWRQRRKVVQGISTFPKMPPLSKACRTSALRKPPSHYGENG